MAKVKYTGPSDVRELNAADLKKVGVDDFKKTQFPRGEAVEVSDAAAKHLLEHDLFGGEFAEAKDEDQASAPALTDAAVVESGEAAADQAPSAEAESNPPAARTTRR